MLIEKMALEVGEHIVQVMDIVAHCLDMSLLKNKGEALRDNLYAQSREFVEAL